MNDATSTTEPPSTTPTSSLMRGNLAPGRRIRNSAVTGFIWFCVALACIPIALTFYFVVAEGASIFSWAFLTEDIPPTLMPGPGMGPAVWGTITITLVASLIAIPLGILGAIYLHEYGKTNALAKLIRFLADVLTGVPSIVMGLFVYTIWVLNFGQSGFAGSIALACLMLPVVIRSTEEMLRLVPNSLRDASYAVGARRWWTIVRVVLPAALPGIVSGSLLAVARAAGETAPVLFTIGITTSLNVTPNPLSWINQFFATNTTLAQQIYYNVAQTAAPSAQQRAWGAALTLILIVVITMTASRLVARRFSLAR